jgi:wobble nucleotide-excising tRNase
MITKIVIDDVATFTIPSEVIPRRINYIYGGNGSGKTTISRLIANHAIYPNCEIAWSGKNLPAIVYNKDFVKENFEQDTLKGIFTLGKDVPDAEDRIKRLLKEIEAKEKIVSDIEKAIQQLNERFDEQTNSYIDICWDSKIKYSEELKKCLTERISIEQEKLF